MRCKKIFFVGQSRGNGKKMDAYEAHRRAYYSHMFGGRRAVPTTRHVPRASTYVARSRIAGAGDALFATRRIEEGARVASMRMPVEAHGPLRGMPHDSIVYTRGDIGTLDAAWTLGTPKPLWYMINHASNPNTKAVKDGRDFYWVARRMIERGEEITFNYHPGRNLRF